MTARADDLVLTTSDGLEIRVAEGIVTAARILGTYDDLGELLAAHPTALTDCETSTGDDGHALARRLSAVALPDDLPPISIDGERYVVDGTVVGPEHPEHDGETEHYRANGRYGGDMGPCHFENGCRLGHLGSLWYHQQGEDEAELAGWFDDPREGLRAATELCEHLMIDRHGVLIGVPAHERDAIWVDGRVFVLGVEGIQAVNRRNRWRGSAARVDRWQAAELRWSERPTRYEPFRGEVFGEDVWRSARVGAPIDPDGFDSGGPGFVLLLQSPDLAVSDWIWQSRLVKAAGTWDGHEELPALRDPPAIAVLPSGHRSYGIATDADVARATARALWQPGWFELGTSDGGPALALRRDGEAIVAWRVEVATTTPPIEAELLWDDDRWGSAESLEALFARVRPLLADRRRDLRAGDVTARLRLG